MGIFDFFKRKSKEEPKKEVPEEKKDFSAPGARLAHMVDTEGIVEGEEYVIKNGKKIVYAQLVDGGITVYPHGATVDENSDAEKLGGAVHGARRKPVVMGPDMGLHRHLARGFSRGHDIMRRGIGMGGSKVPSHKTEVRGIYASKVRSDTAKR